MSLIGGFRRVGRGLLIISSGGDEYSSTLSLIELVWGILSSLAKYSTEWNVPFIEICFRQGGNRGLLPFLGSCLSFINKRSGGSCHPVCPLCLCLKGCDGVSHQFGGVASGLAVGSIGASPLC